MYNVFASFGRGRSGMMMDRRNTCFVSLARIVAVVLVCALMMSLAGCKLIEKNMEVDASTVVAEALGETVTKAEATTHFNVLLNQYATLYAMYGLSISASDTALIENVKTATLDDLTSRIVYEKELDKQGLALTEEEIAGIESKAQTEYDEAITYNVDLLKAEQPDLSDEDATQTIKDALSSQGITPEYLTEEERAALVTEKLKAKAIEDVVVTEEQVRAEYDTLIATQKEKYDATPAQFGTDLSNGATIAYAPEGFRYVKHILVSIPEEIDDKITELNAQLSGIASARTQLSNQEAALTEIDDETSVELDRQYAEYDEQTKSIEEEIASLREQAQAEVKPIAEEALAKANEDGADFDALIVEYGGDPGMTDDPASFKGYALSEVTTNYVAPFKEGAMSLAKPGDVSELVLSDFGYHIIKYESDIVSGETPFDDVKEELRADMLVTAQNEFFAAKQQEWIDAAKVKIYLNRWTD